MSRKRRIGKGKKITIFVSSAALVGGIAVVMTGTSHASAACDGLAAALTNNQKFIAAQEADPDAQSAARIANRKAVIAQIQAQQKAAGCSSSEGDNAAPEQKPPTEEDAQGQDPAQSASDVVCPGSTVTLSGEGGAPAASSDQFPTGTKLKVTNLDNNKSTTVSVTSASGSCVLLNNAAFEQVREQGKFLIRRAQIERVG
ncbi:hypothetical protein AB0D04_27695 [Streptomyces sp. NPDC048483]|uniref:hypothetical protein n=1 Tax=Streptomyces sp. NPDC048483 TaxID=3154927 RepID=UPI00341B15A1